MSDYEEARELSRRVRKAYEALGPGPRAILRRCATRAELLEEGWFWHLMSGVERDGSGWLAHVVVCFPSAPHRESERFELGAHIRQRMYHGVKLEELPKRGNAFRRLLAVRDREDLTHQLRRVLLRASQPADARGAVDWGVVGADLKFWGDRVRRRWATSFYTTGVEGDLDADLEGATA